MRLTGIVVTCLLLAGCHARPTSETPLAREKFLAVYCDLLQESLRSKNSNANPQTAMENADRILEKHGVTRAQFDTTTGWYNADVRRWKSFFDDAAKELETRELAK